MCLSLQTNWEKQRARLRAREKPIVAYKVVDGNFETRYRLDTPTCQWAVGKQTKDPQRSSSKLSSSEIYSLTVHNALHFFVTKQDALEHCDHTSYRTIVLQVHIQPHDIIAAGNVTWHYLDQSITYRSITATRAKVIKQIK